MKSSERSVERRRGRERISLYPIPVGALVVLLTGCVAEQHPELAESGFTESVDPLASGVTRFSSTMIRESFDYWDIPRYEGGALIVPAPERSDARLVRNETVGGHTYLVTHAQKRFNDPRLGGCHAEVHFGKGTPYFYAQGDGLRRRIGLQLRFPDPQKKATASWRSILQIQNYTPGDNLFKPPVMLWLKGGEDNRGVQLRFPQAAGPAINYDATIPARVDLDDGAWHRLEVELYLTTDSSGSAAVYVDGNMLQWTREDTGANEGWVVNRPTLYAGNQEYDLQMGAYAYFRGADTEVVLDFDDLVLEDGGRE